jgi:heme O synthase-like polyprenyltransferase
MASDANTRAELKNVRNMQFVILLTSLFLVATHVAQFMLFNLSCKFNRENKYMTLADKLFKQNSVQFALLLILIFLFVLIVCSFDRMNAFLTQ